MARKSKFERTMVIIGLMAGIIVWLKRAGTPKALEQGTTTVSEKAHDLIGGVRAKTETLVHERGGGADGSDAGTGWSGADAVAVEPDVHAGEDTVAPEVGGIADPTEQQHGALGGIPSDPATGEGETLAASRDAQASDESAFAYGARPYAADVSDEGVVLTPDSDQEREAVPLDEGFENLGEPGDDTLLTAPDVEDDGAASDAYVGDTTEDADFPAASRGFAEDAEFTDNDENVDAYRDSQGDEFDSANEDDVSGAGGEVDLMNDETPAYEDAGMSIVDSPDEALSADAAGFDDDEMTLGLRDSETFGQDANGGMDADAVTPHSDNHLDVSGTFEEAEATEEMPARQETGAEVESGDFLRDSFVTGQDADSLDSGFNVDAGGAGDAAGTAGAFDRYDAGAGGGEVPRMDHGEGEHLNVSGDFDEADETETIPAAPEGDEAGLTGDDLRESFVTGDDADEAAAAEPGDVDEHVAGTEADHEPASQSAAWSTPAGITLSATGTPENVDDDDRDSVESESEGPATGVDEELADAVSESGDSGLGHDTGGDDLSDAGVETLTEGEDNVADAVDDAVDEQPGDAAADDQATDEPEPFVSTPGDLTGGDPLDMASTGFGDRGTTVDAAAYSPDADDHETDDVSEDVQHQVYRAPSIDGRPGEAPSRAADESDDADADDDGDDDGTDGKRPRKSRRQRRKDSNWVPAGAVKGDGSATCPADHPIKGNANSRIYHRLTDPSYNSTIPEYCFASEDDAQKAGFRAPKGH